MGDDESGVGAVGGALRFRVKGLPRAEIPAKIGTMEVTEALLDDYAGHETLLKVRARHESEKCRKLFDGLRLCILKRLGSEQCGVIQDNYAPCAVELKRSRLARFAESDVRRRTALAARSRELEKAQDEAGAGVKR